MSETKGVLPKSEIPLGVPKAKLVSVITSKNYEQCARRKLQYSKLPVKCQKQSAKNPFKILDTAKISTPRCRKSFSLIDLSPATVDSGVESYRSDKSQKITENERNFERSSENNDSFTKAANIVKNMLILNAWRHRRQEIVDLNRNMERLDEQVKNLNLQIFVLRKLLNKENGRISFFTYENSKLKSRLEETTTEKNSLVEACTKYKNLSEEKMITEKNAQNELENARNLLRSTENQLSRDREKLLRLREDKKFLLDKISRMEIAIVECGNRVKNAERKVENLELELAAKISLVTAADEEKRRCAQKLHAANEEVTKLQEKLHTSEEVRENLLLKIEDFQEKLCDREVAYDLLVVEMRDLKERFARQSQNNRWRSRLLQIAGSLVHVPWLIFRSMAFMSNS